MSEEGIRKRLESLAARGYVEKVVSQGPKADSAPLIYRIKTSSDTAADGLGGTGETWEMIERRTDPRVAVP